MLWFGEIFNMCAFRLTVRRDQAHSTSAAETVFGAVRRRIVGCNDAASFT